MFDSLFEWIYELFYSLDTLVCKILSILYSVFEVFAGIKKVKYGSTDKYLINVFYDNSIINRVYWGMALISIALCFGFTIMIVIKKMFDQGDKVKGGYGDIIRSGLKSILFILLMQFIMLATITLTNTLMQAVDELFTYASTGTGYETITFDSEDYATMARVLNTIGNYSVNPSSRSRYNINTCYNDIRQDMYKLYKKHIFEYTYVKEDAKGESIESWQSVLSSIAQSHDLTKEADIDEYDAALIASIGNAMDIITTSGSNFKPLKEQTWKSGKTPLSSKNSSIDRILFLTGSTSAAKNGQYNNDASIFDSLRYPYLSGEKNIYDLEQVKKDFEINFDFGHLIVIIGGLLLCKQFLVLALNCVARIFNMMLLYIMAPPFLAVMPYDEGGKTKQWTTAFVVQSLSVFGSVVSVRLLMIFVPVIFDSKISLLGGGFPEIIAKLIFLFGAAFTCNKASAMISGILADSAGLQSVQAGDVGSGAASSMGALAKKGASIAAKPITAPLGALGSRAGKELGDWAYSKVKQGGAAVGRGIGAGFKKLGSAMGIGGSKKGGSKQGQAGKNNNKSADKKEQNASNAKNDANTLGLKNNHGAGDSGGKDSGQASGGNDAGGKDGGSGSSSQPQNHNGMGESGSKSGSSEDSGKEAGSGSGSQPQNHNGMGESGSKSGSSEDSGKEAGSGSSSQPQNHNGMGESGGKSSGKEKDLSNLFGKGYQNKIKSGGGTGKNSTKNNSKPSGGGSIKNNSGSANKNSTKNNSKPSGGGSIKNNSGSANKNSTRKNGGGNNKKKDLSNLFGPGYQNKSNAKAGTKKSGAGNNQPKNNSGAGKSGSGGNSSKEAKNDGDSSGADGNSSGEGINDSSLSGAGGKNSANEKDLSNLFGKGYQNNMKSGKADGTADYAVNQPQNHREMGNSDLSGSNSDRTGSNIGNANIGNVKVSSGNAQKLNRVKTANKVGTSKIKNATIRSTANARPVNNRKH